MSSDLAELYQEVVIDHSRRPRNCREMPDAHRHAEGYNPLCGDRISVYLKLADDAVADVSFTGKACAICTASASMMTQAVSGKGTRDVHELFECVHDMAMGEPDADESPKLGKLAALAGVRRYPMRVKCATLPWHTLKAAMEQTDDTVTTE